MAQMTFGGLASGLDTNMMIDQLMELRRGPIDRKEQQIEKNEMTKKTWQDIGMRMRHLRESTKPLANPDTFEAQQALSSNDAAVTATTDGTAEVGEHHINVDKLAQYHTVAMHQDARVEDPTEALGYSGTFRISVGDVAVDITVNEEDSLLDIRDKINQSESGVAAQVTDNRLILQSTEMGEEHAMTLEDVGEEAGDVDVLKELMILDEVDNFANEIREAQNAEFEYNGIDIIRSSNDIDDLVDGVTFSLQDIGAANIQVANDTEVATEAVNAFVEQYNSVNTFIREKLGEEGELRGDSNLMRIERSLRSLVSQPVRGFQDKKYSSLSSIGVTTLDKEGFLQFDPGRLNSALEDDPQAVADLFKFTYTDDEGNTQQDGAAVRLEGYFQSMLETRQDDLGRSMPGMISLRQESIDRRINDLTQRIESREERLLRYEERLIREFTAMEQAISTMQGQSQEMERMVGQLAGFGT